MPIDIRDYMARLAPNAAQNRDSPRPARRRRIHDTSDDDIAERPAVDTPAPAVIVIDNSSEADDIMDLRRVAPQQRFAVRRRRPGHSRFEGEAEEVNASSTSGSDDASSDSDADAAVEYRAAMMSVRNRPNALHQVRAGTTRCAVCRRFAKFLQMFL
jgi:hypothetical protein